MTTECYFHRCTHHSAHDSDDGPFCDMPECLATVEEMKMFQLQRKLQMHGYDIAQLERDNPYNQTGD